MALIKSEKSTRFLHTLSLLLATSILTLATIQSCPVLGPVFPQPIGIQNDPMFQEAKSNLTQQLHQLSQSMTSPWGSPPTNITSFSAGVFTLDSPDLVFSFDWNAPDLVLAPESKKETDRDTRMPIGSCSKVFAVYTYLVEVGDESWNCPVTKYIPELAQAMADPSSFDAIDNVNWEEVTIGDLASQLSGVPRTTPGTPSVSNKCSTFTNCTGADYFENLLQYPPVLAPGTTAIYSNDAYQLLAFALENMTGKTYQEMLEESIFAPLNMSRTSWPRPSDNETLLTATGAAVAPAQGWFPVGAPLPIDGPSGGVTSTITDMARFGRSILNSTLLPPAITRRWLKPHSHTASLRNPVGAPWEISRADVNGRLVDLYTKEGEILANSYSSHLILIPDYNVGFMVIAAGNVTALNANAAITTSGVVSNQIGDVVLPVADAIARSQAAAAFVGDYTSDNTTMSIANDPALPGLSITKFEAAGQDLKQKVFAKAAAVTLQPTNLRSGPNVAFRAISQYDQPDGVDGIVYPECTAWESVDFSHQQGLPSDLFVFTMREDGSVDGVNPRGLGWQVVLKKA